MRIGDEHLHASAPFPGELRATGPLPGGAGARVIRVLAASRLHFGMFGFGHADQPQFGGVGVMVEPPNVELTISPADGFAVRGAHAERVVRFVQTAAHGWALASPPRCQIDVKSPPDHTGLGVGTQLGLAVAAGLRRFLALPNMPAAELAASVGRGARSSVGTHGFELGGLIVDGGKLRGAQAGELVRRLALPEEWRFVLICPAGEQGLAGDRETQVFAQLPPVPAALTQQLWQIASERIVPAVQSGDCEQFGNAVHEFGRLAGSCFAAAQGGPFASPRIDELVAAIRAFGVNGVGQSSWGPTVFAIVPNDVEAGRLVDWLRAKDVYRNLETTIARPSNSRARVDE